MKLLTSYPVRVLATGFVVLTLLSIPLFWLRFLCRVSLSERMPVRNVSIEPSGYISPEMEGDPNLAQRSRVSATMRPELSMFLLGIVDYVLSRSSMPGNSNVYVARSKENWAYFDEKSGQIIYRHTDAETVPDNSRLPKQVQYHIGPEGVSEIPDESLGRFVEPIIDLSWVYRESSRNKPGDLILYDCRLRQFFKIDFDRPQVVKGPELGDDILYDPIRIGLLEKNQFYLDLDWLPPRMETSGYRYRRGRYGLQTGAVIQSAQHHDAGPHLLVLDKSGRIDLLDKEKLQFVGTAGRLPQPATLFGDENSTMPDNMLSYQVKPLYLGAQIDPNESEGGGRQTPDPNSLRYAGVYAASLSRDGTALAVATFDDEGHAKSWISGGRRRGSSPEMAYFGAAWAPMSTVGKYLTESLHPPILSVASCLTASAFEAGTGHRALFLLPNSFVAMNARDNRGQFDARLIATLMLISPSIILAAWLAFRVAKDAAAVGFSKNVRSFWALLTLALGLTGYITYRLTRPKITLVTCCNCGKPRRPDMDTCHRCGGKWDVPELTPPVWRVMNGAK